MNKWPRLWQNIKTKEIRIQKDGGCGSPMWKCWALLLYPIDEANRDTQPIRIELYHKDDETTENGKWEALHY